ncbi:WD40 repeat domain-containing protein [Plantactinospora sonchi]|uniref:WD40 repeat domain-containing protein n=1 Tax=Plantactinospora sonchi TaxID=1544735 RepID=A0ABU7RU40_9ACTN
MRISARTRTGVTVERLLCHPRLPLVAGWDADRPVIRIWEHADGQVRELGTVGTDPAGYGDAIGYDRFARTPSAAWHPHEPLLVVADGNNAARWTPSGTSTIDGVPPIRYHRNVAFSPDGRTLWLSPAEGEDGWESSITLDLTSGTTATGPRWDTGIAAHPGGGLVATLQSDQGATLVLFSRDTAPVLRPLRRALILDCDGYETPTFSPDGRHLAVRGNAYDHSLEVFEFPSLRRVLGLTLGQPSPGYPYPQEWLDEVAAWSRHNVAFGPSPDVLWIGTPNGVVIELGVDGTRISEHEVLPGSAVTALAATATGELLVAGRDGVLLLLTVGKSEPVEASRAAVTEFLAGTSEATVIDMDLLDLTDGTRTWQPGDLETVTEDSENDPSWLRIQAAMNRLT